MPITLHQTFTSYSIVDHQTGELLASHQYNRPHDSLLKIVRLPPHDIDTVIRTITYPPRKGMPPPLWEFRHDIDKHLRLTGLITNQEWLKRGSTVARTLIAYGANPACEVIYDFSYETTLGGLASAYPNTVG